MAAPRVIIADLNEIVFESREKEYGAYQLRKNYHRSMLRATLIAFLLFSMGITSPKVYSMFFSDGPKPKVEMDMAFVADLEDIKIPEDEVIPPPPPPELSKPKPQMKTIEFKVPEPKPDDLAAAETIHDMDSIEKVKNLGMQDLDGDTTGIDFDIPEDTAGTGPGVIEIPDPIPAYDDLVLVEKEPSPINMSEIKKLIGYPAMAKEAEIEGRVIVRVLVGKDGNYVDHKMLKAPHPVLQKAVTNKLELLHFTPGIQAGKPVFVWVTIPFDFRLLR